MSLHRFFPAHLIFFFCFSVYLFPQVQNKIKTLEPESATDTSAINSIISLSNKLRETDPTAALPYFEKAKVNSEKLSHHFGIVYSVIPIAEIKGSTGEIKAGIKLIDEITAKYSSKLSNIQYADLQITKGSLLYDANENDKALALFNDLLKKTDDPLRKAKIHTNRGNSYHATGEYKAAISDYLTALDIFQKLDLPKRVAIIYTNLGMSYQTLSEFSKSLDYYKKALVISEQTGDSELLAQSYSNMGVTYEKMDSLDLAVECYKKGLKIGQQQQNPLRIAQNLLNLGSLYTRQKKYEQALNQFNESIKICYDNGISYGVMLNYSGLGSLYHDMGNFQRAIVNLDSALVYAKNMNLPNDEISIYDNLASAHEKIGNYKEALFFHKKNVELRDSLLQ